MRRDVIAALLHEVAGTVNLWQVRLIWPLIPSRGTPRWFRRRNSAPNLDDCGKR